MAYDGWKKMHKVESLGFWQSNLEKISGPLGQKLNTFEHDSEQGESFGAVFFLHYKKIRNFANP